MQLERLVLKNFCQHEYLDLQFQPGLVGIYGPNGVGKSNALNVGGYAGLTGDFSRHKLGRDGCIRQQAEPDEESYVELYANHKSSFCVRRGLRPDGHILTMAGEEPIKGAKRVEQRLSELLGTGRQLIDNYIFVSQWAMFAFISETEAERAKSFAQLCGTMRAEHCWSLLGKQIEQLQPLAQCAVDDADILHEQIGDQKSKIRTAKQLKKTAQENILTPKVIAELVAMQRLGARRNELLNSSAAAEKEKAKFQQLVAKTSAKLAANLAAIDKAKLQLTAATTLAEKARQEQTQLARWRELTEQKLALEFRLRVTIAAAPDVVAAVTDETVEACREEQRNLLNNVERYSTLLASADTPTCPTCESTGEAVVKQQQLARRKLPEARKLLDEVTCRLASLTAGVALYQKYERQKAVFDARVAGTQKQLSDIAVAEEPPTAATEAELAACIAKPAELQEDLQTLEAEYNNCKTLLAQYTAYLKNSESALASAMAGLAKLATDDDDTVAGATLLLDRHRQAELAIAGQETVIELCAQHVTRCEQLLENISRRRVRSLKAGRLLEHFTALRDKFHRNNLPRYVHQTRLEEVEDLINANLDDFCAPFHVKATPDLTLTAYFDNGTISPATILSGGEKMQLALCYRLAFNAQFDIGLMVLDEPTDGLDEENRERTAEVFSRLGEIARARGYQILVVTHDSVLERIFNQRLVLERQ